MSRQLLQGDRTVMGWRPPQSAMKSRLEALLVQPGESTDQRHNTRPIVSTGQALQAAPHSHSYIYQ